MTKYKIDYFKSPVRRKSNKAYRKAQDLTRQAERAFKREIQQRKAGEYYKRFLW